MDFKFFLCVRTEIGSWLVQLQPLADETLDLVVVGCGPAGMCLAAEAAKQGLNVGLVGPDMPFVNNYGVWTDEFDGTDSPRATNRFLDSEFSQGHVLHSTSTSRYLIWKKTSLFQKCVLRS